MTNSEDIFKEALPDELAEAGLVLVEPHFFPVVDDPEARSIFMKLESLGADCEFGLVQRRFGAEPLGLLRWVSVFPESLIALLEARFDGYGNAETSEISVAPWGELIVYDRNFKMRRHSFVNQDGVNIEDFKLRESRRIGFLRNKLLSDLAAAEKIFVYHWGKHLDPNLIPVIHKSVAAIGPARLLVVQLADERHAAGSVVDGDDGLLLGYIDRFGPRELPEGGSIWDISFDVWKEIARNALRFARS